MKILLIVPNVKDQVIKPICSEFEAAGHEAIVLSERAVGLDEQEFDIIVPFESTTEYYIDNRRKFAGRPWVITAIYRGNDLIRCINRFGHNPSEWGVHAVMVSSSHYVSAMPALANAVFCWRPEVKDDPIGEPFEKRGFLLGSVVDNVYDQDFCLAARVGKRFEDKYVLFVRSQEDVEALPKAVRGHAVIHTETPGYERFSFYIPTPSVTDYRCGMLPYETIQSVIHGCWPLLISHPVLKPLDAIIGCYPSLSGFDSMLDSAEQLREAGGRLMNREDCDQFTSTPKEFVRRVLIAYSRSNHNDA